MTTLKFAEYNRKFTVEEIQEKIELILKSENPIDELRKYNTELFFQVQEAERSDSLKYCVDYDHEFFRYETTELELEVKEGKWFLKSIRRDSYKSLLDYLDKKFPDQKDGLYDITMDAGEDGVSGRLEFRGSVKQHIDYQKKEDLEIIKHILKENPNILKEDIDIIYPRKTNKKK